MCRNMKKLILAVLVLFLANGVFGFETNGVKSVLVMEGDSVPLYTCQKDTQKYETILWTYGSEDAVIAFFSRGKPFSFPDGNERFKDRLEIDLNTGSLTIRNIRTNHSGVYKVDMTSTSGSPYIRRFNVTVSAVFDPDADKIIQKVVSEGGSITLNTDVQVQKDVLILWRFAGTKPGVYSRNSMTTICKIDGEASEEFFDHGENEKFKNRLDMDKPTGSLIIKDIRLEHSGFYKLQISNNTLTRHRTFNVTVSAVTKSCLQGTWMTVAIVFMVSFVIMVVIVVVIQRNVWFSKGSTPSPVKYARPDERE
ncbi:uncharacterized protein si:dkey-182g1.10 [Danio rerio]|uniref:Si:dkey-182g1.10 n=1 Tax=Danio rerio TaxID=7955 RepID=A0A0R4IFS8_DANRE|nr:uncharacterized protein si:dkey-182g1.10 isoform X2 [Danio rerio]|eukprot:XP_005161714.1 uncharacterized protein si:dkey-182g1.10 isoform X2 [Danio rerio]